MPISPPIIKTRKIISAPSIIPLIGDLIKAIIPCGFASTCLYVLGMLIGFHISPLVNFSNGILISNRFKVSWVAVNTAVSLKLFLVNVLSILLYVKESYFPEGTNQVKSATNAAIINNMV